MRRRTHGELRSDNLDITSSRTEGASGSRPRLPMIRLLPSHGGTDQNPQRKRQRLDDHSAAHTARLLDGHLKEISFWLTTVAVALPAITFHAFLYLLMSHTKTVLIIVLVFLDDTSADDGTM